MFYLVTNVSKEVIFLASNFLEQLESSDEFVFALLLKNLNITSNKILIWFPNGYKICVLKLLCNYIIGLDNSGLIFNIYKPVKKLRSQIYFYIYQ